MELTDKHIFNIARKYNFWWSSHELLDFARKLIAAHCRAAQKLRRLPLQPFTEHDLRQSWNRCEPGTPWDSLESWEQLAWAQQQAILADRTARPMPLQSPEAWRSGFLVRSEQSDGKPARTYRATWRAAPAFPPSSPHTPPSPAAAPSPAGSTDEAPGSPPRPPLADALRIQCTGSRSPDDLADALRYLRPFVDDAHAIVSRLEALERIQDAGREDVEYEEGDS